MKKYKTKNNLQEIWKQLDDACGFIDNATTDLAEMTNLPNGVLKELESVSYSFDAIVALKNEIEELMNK